MTTAYPLTSPEGTCPMKPIEWDGLAITKAGIYAGVPIETYHQQLCDTPSVSKSGLWEIAKKDGSPAHYFHGSYLNPEAEPFEESEALIIGRGAHHLLLGESDFHGSFAIRPAMYPEGVEYPRENQFGPQKAWHGGARWCKAWEEDHSDFTVLKPDHIKRIRGMSKTLGEHPMVQGGILNGLVEHTLVWRDVETGLWLKVRPDVIPTDDLDVADLKTAASVSDSAIDRAIGDYGYYVQGALIRMAFENVLGAAMNTFSLVFVESQPPHCVRVVTLKHEDLELGEMLARTALRLMAKCLERGEWPGPGGRQSDAVYAGITPWARQDADFRLQRMQAELEGL
jgi:hypothetical protein